MLTQKLRERLRKKLNSDVLDIIVFGSSVKGRLFPGDTDICVIVRDDADIFMVQRNFDDVREEAQITFVKLKDLLEKHLLLKQALVHEGFSLRFGEFVHKLIGFEAFTIFTFSLTNLSQSEKIRFQYALYGRGKEDGILKKCKGEKLGRGVIAVPVLFEAEIEDFFKLWRAEYRKERVLRAVS